VHEEDEGVLAEALAHPDLPAEAPVSLWDPVDYDTAGRPIPPPLQGADLTADYLPRRSFLARVGFALGLAPLLAWLTPRLEAVQAAAYRCWGWDVATGESWTVTGWVDHLGGYHLTHGGTEEARARARHLGVTPVWGLEPDQQGQTPPPELLALMAPRFQVDPLPWDHRRPDDG
jgi:hypothetical protein